VRDGLLQEVDQRKAVAGGRQDSPYAFVEEVRRVDGMVVTR
jgi:hypothetical protein